MSKIKIVGHASGSGVLTIAAPNTNTDRTITIPDATGTLLDSGSDLPAANLTGTIADARLAAMTASKLTGTIADARFPATLPAASAANLTAIPAANITGTLPAISGANLTGIAATVAALTDATVSTSDPAANTNPSSGTGHLWINKTGGEAYICVDATSNSNQWKNIGAGAGNVNMMSATGGTITTYTSGGQDYKVHTFTSSGTFEVTGGGEVDALVIGGGGGGGDGAGSGETGTGGGAGAMLEGTGLTINAGTYTVTIGSGGAGGNGTWNAVSHGHWGTDTKLGAFIIAWGGGGGGGQSYTDNDDYDNDNFAQNLYTIDLGGSVSSQTWPAVGGPQGGAGGSGGGVSGAASGAKPGGEAIQPSWSIPGSLGSGTVTVYGNDGGDGAWQNNGSAGGGAGGAGGTYSNPTAGLGRANAFKTGSNITYATGGSGHSGSGNAGANTGSGGNNGSAGANGIVVIRYAV